MSTTLTFDEAWYRERLRLPGPGRHRVVIDADAANEIDDQFALAWALSCRRRLDIVGLYAEPFSFAHRRADHPAAPADAAPFNPPAVGMARSYEEIHRVVGLMGESIGAFDVSSIQRGSPGYLPGPGEPIDSDAARHLIEVARAQPVDGAPLYVLALGCVTNIASALLMAPDIRSRIVVVWTSGYPSYAPWVNHSFNLEQDLWASQHLFDCGVPLVYLPGYHVGAQLRFSLQEMQSFVRGRSAVGDALYALYTHNPLWPMLGWPEVIDSRCPYSWVIWDIICVAWLLEPAWVPSELVPTPRLDDARIWRAQPGRPPMREAYALDRDRIFGALAAALSNPDLAD